MICEHFLDTRSDIQSCSSFFGKLLENTDEWKRPISLWQRNLQMFVCPCLFQASVGDLSYLDTWESISWFLSKERAYFQCLGFLSSVNKWQKELSNLKVYLIRVICGYRWSTWSLVSFASIPKMQDLEAGTECAWQDVFPFTAALVVPLFPFLDKTCRTLCSCPTTALLMVPSCSGLFCALQDGQCFKGKPDFFLPCFLVVC